MRPEALDAMLYAYDEYKKKKESKTMTNPYDFYMELRSVPYHRYSYSYGRDLPKIKNVIFNEPATIVFWADNTKTVVKCQEGDEFDPEKGLTMAITKKIFGNKGNYCNEIKKWTEPYYEKMEMEQECDIGTPGLDALYEAAKKCLAAGLIVKYPGLMAGADLDGDSEKDRQSYDPVQKAYDLLVDFHHNNKTTDLDEIIGYLGEALDK